MRTIEGSPQLYARIAGILYLLIIVVGLSGEAFVRQELIVAGNATATAANILASRSLWHMTLAAELAYLIGALVWLLILYVLLRPVSRNLALLMVFFNLTTIALEVANKFNLVAASSLLEGADHLKTFLPEQLHALAYQSLTMYSYGFAISLIFFGCVCLVLGHLIRRSSFLPGSLGALMQIAGVCYLTNSFALLAAPNVAEALFPYILIPPFVAESSLCLWLIAKGLDAQRWREQPGVG